MRDARGEGTEPGRLRRRRVVLAVAVCGACARGGWGRGNWGPSPAQASAATSAWGTVPASCGFACVRSASRQFHRAATKLHMIFVANVVASSTHLAAHSLPSLRYFNPPGRHPLHPLASRAGGKVCCAVRCHAARRRPPRRPILMEALLPLSLPRSGGAAGAPGAVLPTSDDIVYVSLFDRHRMLRCGAACWAICVCVGGGVTHGRHILANG